MTRNRRPSEFRRAKLDKKCRHGFGSLDVILCLAATLPIAAGLYWIFEEGMEMYILTLGTAVGWPLM